MCALDDGHAPAGDRSLKSRSARSATAGQSYWAAHALTALAPVFTQNWFFELRKR